MHDCENNYVKGYVTFKIFKVKVCTKCSNAVSDMHPIVEFLFEKIFSHFWNGLIIFEEEEGD